MVWSLTPRRRDEPELMDAPGLPESEVAAAYQVLGQVNQQLGNLRVTVFLSGGERRQGTGQLQAGQARVGTCREQELDEWLRICQPHP